MPGGDRHNGPATAEEAVNTAARLLRFAEDESDLSKVESLARLAEVWSNLGAVLREMEP